MPLSAKVARQLLTRAGLPEAEAQQHAERAADDREKAMLLTFLDSCIRAERHQVERIEIGNDRAYTSPFVKQDLDCHRARQDRFQAIKRIVEAS